MRARTYLVDSLPIHLPTYQLQHNMELASWCHLRRVDAIHSLVKNDRRNRTARSRNVVSIISDTINRHDTSKDSEDIFKNAFARIGKSIVAAARDFDTILIC